MESIEFLFLVKKEKGGATIYSADGKIEYAFLIKIKNGKVIRVLFYEPICGGIMAEGTPHSDLDGAVLETEGRIREFLRTKKPGK